jgi:hypothetical protein
LDRIKTERRNQSGIGTLIDQLDAALKEAGIEKNSFDEKYSIYSLRHFYAVNALRNGVGVFEVARNMGTSKLFRNIPGSRPPRWLFATRLEIELAHPLLI